MGYGISVKSSNNTVQIDSDRPYCYLKATQISSGLTITTTDITDLIFIKPSGVSTAVWGTNPVSNTTFDIYANTTNTSTDYLVLRPTKVSAATTGYGLQVFNVDGLLAFDSGIFTSTAATIPYVTRVIDSQGAYGNYSTIYTGADYLSVYACVNNSIKYNSSVVIIHSFKWDQATTSIQYISQIAATPPGFGVTYYNQCSILLVKLI